MAWFMRGHNLYRRVLLVVPGLNLMASFAQFPMLRQQRYIRSWRQGSSCVANTLGDLTRRECRFGHSLPRIPLFVFWGALRIADAREATTCDPCTPPNTSPLTGTPTGSQ